MRVTLFFVALFTILSAVVASPLPLNATDTTELEVRASSSRTGKATWFNVGLGACGKRNKDSDKILAVSAAIYGNGKYCEKTVTIKNNKNGKTATGTVRDECPGCGANDLDLSPTLFKQLGSLDTGVLGITWHFN